MIHYYKKRDNFKSIKQLLIFFSFRLHRKKHQKNTPSLCCRTFNLNVLHLDFRKRVYFFSKQTDFDLNWKMRNQANIWYCVPHQNKDFFLWQDLCNILSSFLQNKHQWIWSQNQNFMGGGGGGVLSCNTCNEMNCYMSLWKCALWNNITFQWCLYALFVQPMHPIRVSLQQTFLCLTKQNNPHMTSTKTLECIYTCIILADAFI